jgi:hypothetical protein
MTTPAAAARLLLVERRDTVAPRNPDAPKIRRYRLARLDVNARRAPGRARFDHLQRSYD